MRPRIQTGRLYKDGTEKYVYSCTLKEKSRCKKCTGKNINGNEIDALLVEKIKNIFISNQKISGELKNIINTKAKIIDKNDEYIFLKNKYEKNQRNLENLIQKIRYVDIDLIDDINKKVKNIKKENEEIAIKLNKYNEEKDINKLEVDVAQIVLDIIENYFDKFRKLDIMDQKKLLRLIINNVFGNGSIVEVNLLTDNLSAFLKPALLPSGENSK
jgi:site-specific DNA recombinase